ncbi:MAG: lytic transglycosylase catalytic [Betaproteobacteria bacterium]|nr:lytic transglycosylase catalytic [Betaproteobacteria bacterium]
MSRPFSTFWLCLLSVPAGPCCADIYGFVDEQGAAHLSTAPLDGRYVLIAKELSATGDAPANPADDARARKPMNDSGIAQARKQYAPLVAQIALEQNVDAALLHAVITVESGYNVRARSRKGASGLMQLMPDTAIRYGVDDVWNPAQNVRAGARLLRDLLVRFGGDLRLALAAYNAGAGAVIASGNRIPAYAETRSYVPRVLEQIDRLRARTAL